MIGARRLTISTFGVIAGVAGIEHGIGAVLQGNQSIEHIFFESWPDSEAFRALNGEPAMTLIPNYLATGTLAILASFTFMLWAIGWTHTRFGGPMLILLSLVMLLVGAGFGPPLVGLILGISALRLDRSPSPAWLRRFGDRRLHLLGSTWALWYGAAVVCWLLLFPGTVLFVAIAGADPQGTAVSSAVGALSVLGFVLLTGSILSATAHEAWEVVDAHGLKNARSVSP